MIYYASFAVLFNSSCIASTTENYGGGDDYTATGLAFNIGGGIAYFIKENIAANFGLSYTLARMKDVDDEKGKLKEGNFGANIGFSIFF